MTPNFELNDTHVGSFARCRSNSVSGRARAVRAARQATVPRAKSGANAKGPVVAGSCLWGPRHEADLPRPARPMSLRARPGPSTLDRASAACRARARPQDAPRAGSPGLLLWARPAASTRRVSVSVQRSSAPSGRCRSPDRTSPSMRPCCAAASRSFSNPVPFAPPRQQARGFQGNTWDPAQPAHCTCPRPRAGRREWRGSRAAPRSSRCLGTFHVTTGRDTACASRRRAGRSRRPRTACADRASARALRPAVRPATRWAQPVQSRPG